MSEDNGLPRGWAETTLGDVLQPLENGKALHHGWSPQCESQPSPSDDVWGVLKTTAVQDGEYQSEHNKTLPSSLEPRPDLEVKTGDMLLTCAGPRSRCGVPCLVRHTRPRLILSGKMYRFRPYDALLSPAFLEGYLRAKDTQIAIDAMKTGISDSGLNLTHDRFLRLPVRLPSLPEQHRIVEKIDELFSDLDAGVVSLQRAKANLKRYRAAVLKSAVEGRLTEEWRKEHLQAEDGAFLEDNWVPLEEVITLLGQGWSPKCESAAATDDAEWAVIKTSAIQSMAFVPDENKQLPDTLTPRPELVIEPGDLLITRAGPRSRAGVTCLVRHTRPRLILCDKAYRVRFDETRALPAFVEVVLNAPNFLDRLDELKTGISDSGVNLTQKKFVDLAIPLPPLAEQEQIVALVEERLSQIDSAEKTIDAELIRAKRLRQSILKRAFEGKLVPQNPKDEPASVLLERIKAAREAEQPKKKAKKVKAK